MDSSTWFEYDLKGDIHENYSLNSEQWGFYWTTVSDIKFVIWFNRKSYNDIASLQ